MSGYSERIELLWDMPSDRETPARHRAEWGDVLVADGTDGCHDPFPTFCISAKAKDSVQESVFSSMLQVILMF